MIVPTTPVSKFIVSGVVSWSAWVMASRSVPGPESPRLVTLIVVGTTRLSMASTHGRSARLRRSILRVPGLPLCLRPFRIGMVIVPKEG